MHIQATLAPKRAEWLARIGIWSLIQLVELGNHSTLKSPGVMLSRVGKCVEMTNSDDHGSPQLQVDVSATSDNYGWLSVYPALQSIDSAIIRSALERFVSDCGLSQSIAWDRSIPIVKSGTAVVLVGHTVATRFSAIFEYELPREGGRRPDVVLLQNGVVVVIEFKDRTTIASADLDQVAAYVESLNLQ
jgi:hypothetical protein